MAAKRPTAGGRPTHPGADRTVTQLATARSKLRNTNEKLRECKLIQSEGRHRGVGEAAMLARILGHVPAGIAYMDPDLIVRWANPALGRLLGVPQRRILGRSLFASLPGAEPQLGPVLRGVLTSGKPFIGAEFRFSHLVNGEQHVSYWDFSCVPILGKKGVVDGLLVMDIDASERAHRIRESKQEIAQLRELDRMKDEFLSVISHELRTPLNFILGFSSLLDDEAAGPLNAKQHEFVGKILNGADRMLVLVNDLLDMAKIEAGRLDLAAVPTPVEPLIDEVISTMMPLAQDRGVVLEADVQVPGLPCVDGPRIVQVITNLVSNAIKATEAGGHIKVRAFVDGQDMVVQVCDTGIGIAPEDLAVLFKRFTQLDMSSTRKLGGTGLGLAISKALIEAHGGKIGAISEPGKGSTFYFMVPLTQPMCDGEP